MTYDELKDVLGRNLGQRLTPELVLGILTAQKPQPVPMPAPLQIASYSYQRESVNDALDGGADELAKLHWEEVEMHRHELGFVPDWARMAAWEDEGRFVGFTVRHTKRVVGYMAFHLTDGYHTTKRVATEDGLYLLPAHRRGLTAVRLIRYAEQALRQLGAGEIHVITKAGTTADRLMDRLGYPAVSNLHIKVLGD
jgi:GNAT superfamily N-acetyltransferase